MRVNGFIRLIPSIAQYGNDILNCQFAGASYDHSIATAVWDICQDSLIDTYKEALEDHGIPYDTLKPALRLTSSDVGISGANIYPMLLSGRDEKIMYSS